MKIRTVRLQGVETQVITPSLRPKTHIPLELEFDGHVAGEISSGLAAQIRESRVRVAAALASVRPASNTFETVSVPCAPEAGLDLALALRILLPDSPYTDSDPRTIACFGELGFDGNVRPVRGALVRAEWLASQGHHEILVPIDNAREVALVTAIDPTVRIIQVRTLREALDHAIGKSRIGSVDLPTPLRWDGPLAIDLRADIEQVTRLVESHEPILLVGRPGSGKTIAAKAIVGLAGEPTTRELLDATRLYSAAGLLTNDRPAVTARPFRAPHHSVSEAGMFGTRDRPFGEWQLARGGVLYLDELPEYRRTVLDGVVRRLGEPDAPRVVASANPCPCGRGGQECRCTDAMRERYIDRIPSVFTHVHMLNTNRSVR